MALQVWLPLTKNLSNQGLNNMTFSIDAGSNIILDNNGKIGACYSRSAKQTSGRIVSNSTINLSEDISMACWALVSDCVGDTANGLISNHSHANNTGVGITVKQVSTSDYRISCNTGTGSDRTFYTYYGTTNIKGAWHHLALTYSKSAKQLILYVDGNAEYTLNNYVNSSIADYIIIFDWSTTYNSTSYRPAAKLNDVRIYDHCLSPKEVKEISKGLVLHYLLNDAYVEGTTNIASNLSPSQIGGWQKMTITKLSTNNYHLKHQTSDSTNLSYWSTFVYTLPSEYSNKTISFSARIKNIVYNDIKDSSWLYIGPGNNGQYPTHGSAMFYCYELKENQLISWTGVLSNSNRYVLVELWNDANSTSGSIEFDLVDIQIEEKDHVTPYTPNTRNETTVYDCSGYQNNGTIFRALNCIEDSPRYKISTHFTSSIPSRINLPSDMSCLSGNNEQTLSCWVRSSGLGSGMALSGLISLGYGNTLFLDASYYGYRIDNGSSLGVVGANQNPHDGNWHLVTATYKSGVASIYIDGILKNSMSRIFSNRYINIGGNCIGTEVNNSPVYNLNGDISDIRMYATALSADDVKELYNTSCIINS